MDAFSDVLRVIRLAGGVFLEAEFTAPWCISGQLTSNDCKPFLVTPRHVIASHFVAAGNMQLRVEGGDAIDVRAGELVLLPHNHAHTFGSDLNLSITVMPARQVIQPPQGSGISRINYGGGGEATQLLCGFLGSETSFSPLLASLPPVLKLDVRATASGAWIESSFRFAASEIAAGRIGSTTVITKLSELLFVEAVSQFVGSLPAERRGWLAGLRDPQVGRALAALHSRPSEAWTAENLALEMGMSRSALQNGSLHWSDSHRCSTSLFGACSWLPNSCAKDAGVWRRLPLKWATSPKQRSVVHSNGNSGKRRVSGAGSRDEEVRRVRCWPKFRLGYDLSARDVWQRC